MSLKQEVGRVIVCCSHVAAETLAISPEFVPQSSGCTLTLVVPFFLWIMLEPLGLINIWILFAVRYALAELVNLEALILETFSCPRQKLSIFT